MEKIEWSTQFSVGVENIDKQHRRLVDMINRLIVSQKTVSDQTVVNDLLHDMTGYAKTHFRAEEELFARYGYSDTQRHMRQHLDFIEKIELFKSADGVSSRIVSKTMLDYLRKWLVNHILREDMKYKAFFREKGVK